MIVDKLLRLICLLAVLGTAGRQPWATAADTLRAVSQREVNSCLADPTALVTVDLGQIFASDSLMLFDITLTFDFTKIVFTDLLTQGTLSEQVTGLGKPIMNTSVPGEARVSAFTISTPIFGNKPLFAVRGTPISDCIDTIDIGLAFVEFNSEFKRTVDTYQGDTVIVRTIPRPTSSIRAEYLTPSDTTRGQDSTVVVRIRIERGTATEQPMDLAVESEAPFTVDTVLPSNDHTVIENQERTTSGWSLRLAGSVVGDPFELAATIRSTTNDSTSAAASLNLTLDDPCICEIPENTNPERLMMIVNARVPIVSVGETVNEEPVMITIGQGAVIAQCVHGQPDEIVIRDLLGKELILPYRRIADRIEVPTGSLPGEPLVVLARCGQAVSVKMILIEP